MSAPARWLLVVLALAVWSAAAQTASEPVLLEDALTGPQRGWQVDGFSRFDADGYVVDARNQGGYPRWVNEPANVRDTRVKVELEPLAAGGQAGAGLLLRLQDSWANAYVFLVGGDGRYRFGKFVAGKLVVLKEGAAPSAPAQGRRTVLEVVAVGSQFRLSIDGQAMATVMDATFPSGGRLGLFTEAPWKVRYSRLRAVQVDARNGIIPPKVRFADSFDGPGGWPIDANRRVADGAYHMVNQGEARSYVSWNAETDGLGDLAARVDARWLSGSAKALFGLLWHVRDASNYYYFVINPDGRFYAGRCTDGTPTVLRNGRHLSVRPGDAINSLEVRVAGTHHRLLVNRAEVAGFDDGELPRGSMGFYLQEPAEVSFDDLLVTELPDERPIAPVRPDGGGTEGGPWKVGTPLVTDGLSQNDGGGGWPSDGFHGYEEGGYVVKAPDRGSRTTLRSQPSDMGDGVICLRVRPVLGPVQAGMGLAFRANRAASSFYFLLINGAGRYFLGKCVEGQYTVLDSGPVNWLRGGDLGNELQVTLEGPVIRYGVNDRQLGVVQDDSLSAGAVGLHVENGVVACFRDLRLYSLPGAGTLAPAGVTQP